MADIEGLREPLRTIVKQIIAEAQGRVTIVSGHRSHEEQKVLYDRYLAGDGNKAAKPGTSMHEFGQAVDFGGDLELAARLAKKHGLIASVPGEDWHFTLGGEHNYEGDPDFGSLGLGYNLDSGASPESVLANRLTAVTRILGLSPDGVGSPSGVPMDVFGDANPYTSVQNPTPSVGAQAGMGQPEPQGGGTATATMAGLSGGSAGEFQKYAHSLFQQYGFSDEDFGPLVSLWNRESGWNPMAANPHSSARGIAQKMTSIHGAIESTPQAQIQWGLNYIKDRYGSPANAWAHSQRYGWY